MNAFVINDDISPHEHLALSKWQAADLHGALVAYQAAIHDYQQQKTNANICRQAHCWRQMAELSQVLELQDAFGMWQHAQVLYESLLTPASAAEKTTNNTSTAAAVATAWAETLQEQGIAYIQQQDYLHAVVCHERVLRKASLLTEESSSDVLSVSTDTVQTLMRTLGGGCDPEDPLLRQVATQVYIPHKEFELAADLLQFLWQQEQDLESLQDLAWIYQEHLHQYEQAALCQEQILLSKSQRYGENHVETTKALFAVARVMGLAGNAEGSWDLYQAAKQKYVQHVLTGDDSLDYQEIVTELSTRLDAVENQKEDDEDDKSKLYYDLGRAYIGLGDYVSATICLVEAAKEEGAVTEEQVVAVLQHVEFLQRQAALFKQDEEGVGKEEETGSSTPVTWEDESKSDPSASASEATPFYDSDSQEGVDAIPRSDVSSSESESLSDLPSIAIDPIPQEEEDAVVLVSTKELGSLGSSFLTPPEAAPRELVIVSHTETPVKIPNEHPVLNTPESAKSNDIETPKSRRRIRSSFAGKFIRRRKDGFESLGDDDEEEEDNDKATQLAQELPCEDDYHSLTTNPNLPIQYVNIRSSSWESAVSQVTMRMDDPNSSRESGQEWWWGVTSEGFARWFPAAYVSQAVEAAEGFLSAKAIHEKKNQAPEPLKLFSGQDGVESVDERLPPKEETGALSSNGSKKDAAPSADGDNRESDAQPPGPTSQHETLLSASQQVQIRSTTDLNSEIAASRDRLAQQQKELGKTHPDVAMTHFTLAVLYSRNHSVSLAVDSATEALRIQKANGSTVDSVRSLHFLADLHLHQKQFKSSLSYYAESLRLERDRYGYYSDETAKTLNCIGATRSFQNEFALAMESHQEALRILKHSHGEDPKHPLVSDTLCQIGSVYYRERNSLSAIKTKKSGYSTFIEGGMLEVIGRAHEDRGSYKMALSFFEEKLQFLESRGEGEETLEEAATTLNSLGMLSARAGLYGEAIDFYERALSLQLQLGCDEVDVAQARVLTGSVHCHLGHYTQALKLLQDALVVLEDELGKQHETVAATLYQIGIVHASLLEHKVALDVLNQALELQTEMLGDDHPATLRTRREIGKMYAIHGNEIDSALEIFDEVLNVQKQIHGKRHPNIADTLHCIGCAYSRKGDYPNALRSLEECYYMRLEFLGCDHPLQASTLHEITKIHMARGRLEKASHICDVVLRIRSETLTDQHIDVALTLSTKGSCCVARGNISEATHCLKVALAMGERAVGARHPCVAEIHTELGLLNLRKCQFDDARREIQLALDMYREGGFDENHPSVLGTSQKLARVEREEMLCV